MTMAAVVVTVMASAKDGIVKTKYSHSKTKNEIKDWINIFSRTNKKDFQIVKLKLTGNIFTGDASFILRQNISLNRKKKQAKMYWNGEKKDNINEYLFIGTAVVEDILKIEDF